MHFFDIFWGYIYIYICIYINVYVCIYIYIKAVFWLLKIISNKSFFPAWKLGEYQQLATQWAFMMMGAIMFGDRIAYVNLVSGLNPSEKYYSIGMIIPNIWENKKCSKPPTSNLYSQTNPYGGFQIYEVPSKSSRSIPVMDIQTVVLKPILTWEFIRILKLVITIHLL